MGCLYINGLFSRVSRNTALFSYYDWILYTTGICRH